MKKFNSVHKGNGRNFVLIFVEGESKVKAFDIEKNQEKDISKSTVKRWHEVGSEIKPEVKKKQIAKESKKTDRRKKVTAEQVIQIRIRNKQGESISSLANNYGMSYSGMYWIVKGNTWAYLDEEAV